MNRMGNPGAPDPSCGCVTNRFTFGNMCSVDSYRRDSLQWLEWRLERTMKSLFIYAIDKVSVCRSIKIALVVGTMNALVTQYDAVFHKTLTLTNFFQIMLTYMIPFGVATISSALQARRDDLKETETPRT